MQQQRKSAFTLIELLIVVAIIAILAAIAVPNFLEAQTRSKVTRCLSDMRATGIATTSYMVDYNQPMFLSKSNGYSGWLLVYNDNAAYPGRLLTTPIAYMSRLPVSDFNTAHQRVRNQAFLKGKQVSWWSNMVRSGTRDPGIDSWIKEMQQRVGAMFPPRMVWLYESAGPALTWWSDYSNTGPATRDPNRYLYDPTNGTISQGMIVLADSGWISGNKFK